ncbi:MAG: DnaJ domain-containing protein [Synechococcus lacustris]|jgi:DnaJ-class molecular chaperone
MASPTIADHWAVLGLEPGADAAALKKAFRRQARRWHPDLNNNDPAAEERFKRINEAYAVLSDPRRRQAWEAGGEPGDQDPFARGFPEFHDYLDNLFGRRRPQEREDWPATTAPAPPPPVQAQGNFETVVELSPEQALGGTTVTVALDNGLTVELQTPPEAGDGWRLRLEGVAPGGGDHFLQLQVRTADELRIDGLRVLYRLDLSAADGALGVHAVVPTLQGPVRLRIPPGTSSGRLLRLRGRGLEHQGRRGDQIVEVRLVVPEQVNEAEEALYRRLQELQQ